MENHNKENEIVKVLKEDWNKIEAIGGTPKITQQEIQEQLHAYKMNRKRAFKKELSLFILTAIFILTLLVTTIVKSVQAIIYIQVCACLIGPIVYVILSKREGKVEQ